MALESLAPMTMKSLPSWPMESTARRQNRPSPRFHSSSDAISVETSKGMDGLGHWRRRRVPLSEPHGFRGSRLESQPVVGCSQRKVIVY